MAVTLQNLNFWKQSYRLVGRYFKVFTERGIDIDSINSRTSKKGIATIVVSFYTKGKDELSMLSEKLRQIESVFEIERTTG